jgi:hypothetical protein
MTGNDGRNLEAAAEAIERLLLAHRAELEGQEIVVTPRKRQVINGVLHEFDLWISAGQAGLFLVECKDWSEEKVGKDEVIIFTEKLRVTNAIGGYVVARSFTRYAEAQARLWDGLKLQVFNNDLDSLNSLPSYHTVYNEITQGLNIVLFDSGDEVPNPEQGFLYQGRHLSANQMTHDLLHRAINERISTVATGDLPDGPNQFTYDVTYSFEPGELSCDGKQLTTARVRVVFNTTVEHTSYVWHYNLVDRGVSVRYRSGTQGYTLETTFTQVTTDSGETQTGLTATLTHDNGHDD